MYEKRDRPATTLSLMPSASAVRSASPVRSVNGMTATWRSEALISDGVPGLLGVGSGATGAPGAPGISPAAEPISRSRCSERSSLCTSRAV